jgi:hypothetical protein
MERVRGPAISRMRKWYNSKIVYFLENYIGNVIISEVDALMYVILSKAEKHIPNGEGDGTRNCMML